MNNIVGSFLYKGISILCTLLIVPLTLDYVDATSYGIWLTISSLIAWMNFFDIGLGHGLRNKLTEAIANNDTELAKKYVSSAYFILAMIATACFLVFFVINHFLDWSTLLNAPRALSSELSVLVLFVFLFFCIQFVAQLIGTITTADQQPSKNALFQMLGNVGALIAIAAFKHFTDSSLLFLGISFSLPILVIYLFASFFYFNRKYKVYAPSLRYFEWEKGKSLLSLGGRFFILQLAAVMIYQTSNLIIIHVCDPAAVTSYNIAFRYFGVATMAFGIFLSPYWSAYTEAQTKNDFEWMKRTLRSIRKVWILFSIGVIVMLLVSSFVYTLWIKDAVEIPVFLSVTMAIYVIFNAWNSIYSTILCGLSKVNIMLTLGIISAFLNLPLSIFFCYEFGVAGVPMASFFLCFNTFATPYQVHKLLNNKAKGIWNK